MAIPMFPELAPEILFGLIIPEMLMIIGLLGAAVYLVIPSIKSFLLEMRVQEILSVIPPYAVHVSFLPSSGSKVSGKINTISCWYPMFDVGRKSSV